MLSIKSLNIIELNMQKKFSFEKRICFCIDFYGKGYSKRDEVPDAIVRGKIK